MDLSHANELTKQLMSVEWVKIIHPNTAPAINAEMKRIYAEENNTSHCSVCLNLNGCCFVIDKCPAIPHHPNCHCHLDIIQNIPFIIECPIEKFTNYVFVQKEANDKKHLFELWGFDASDAQYFHEEFQKQAYYAYSTGNYTLANLNDYTQTINIEIKIQRKDTSELKSFKTGWSVYPDGKIKLATPYANQNK